MEPSPSPTCESLSQGSNAFCPSSCSSSSSRALAAGSCDWYVVGKKEKTRSRYIRYRRLFLSPSTSASLFWFRLAWLGFLPPSRPLLSLPLHGTLLANCWRILTSQQTDFDSDQPISNLLNGRVAQTGNPEKIRKRYVCFP